MTDKKLKKLNKKIEKLFKKIHGKDFNIVDIQIGFKNNEITQFMGDVMRVKRIVYIEATAYKMVKKG